MPDRRVAVVGGGWAGLAAAVTLSAEGVPTTLYESAAQLGGRARRVMHGHTVLDNGQHILLGAYHATLSVLDTVGVDLHSTCLRLPLQLVVKPNFKFKAAALPAPWHLGLGLLAAHGFSWRDKFRALRFLSALKHGQFTVPAMSVNALLARHQQGPDVANYLWRPLCLAALNTTPDLADAQVFVNVLRDAFFSTRADSELILPRVDLGALFPDAAAKFMRAHSVEVHTSCTVSRVIPDAQGFVVSYAHGEELFSDVVCALPPFRVAAVFSQCSSLDDSWTAFSSYIYEPIYTVYLQYPDAVGLDFPMQGLRSTTTQWLFDRGALGARPGLLAAVISARGEHQGWDHGKLVQQVMQEICDEFGIVEVPLWTQVIAEKRATFACTPGIPRPAQVTAHRGLYLAGDYTASDYPATLEAAVRSGIQCALKIIESRA